MVQGHEVLLETNRDENSRNGMIDILRCIGIVAIVIGHALNTTNFPSEVCDYIRNFLYFGVLMGSDAEVLYLFPFSFPALRVVYILFGIVVPIVIGRCFNRIKSFVTHKILTKEKER